MASTPVPLLSLKSLFEEREARLHSEQEAEARLKQQDEEHGKQFYERLQKFCVTDDLKQTFMNKIKRAFDRGETEVMVTSFPSKFCTDEGRAIDNAGEPPINRPKIDPSTHPAPEWLATLPAGVRSLYEFWDTSLRPGGFRLEARIISYPAGKPGDVGIFFTWPKSALDIPS